MGIWGLIRGHNPGSGSGGSTSKGYPPAGSRVPSTGDGKTRTNRKVKLDKPKGGKHSK